MIVDFRGIPDEATRFVGSLLTEALRRENRRLAAGDASS